MLLLLTKCTVVFIFVLSHNESSCALPIVILQYRSLRHSTTLSLSPVRPAHAGDAHATVSSDPVEWPTADGDPTVSSEPVEWPTADVGPTVSSDPVEWPTADGGPTLSSDPVEWPPAEGGPTVSEPGVIHLPAEPVLDVVLNMPVCNEEGEQVTVVQLAADGTDCNGDRPDLSGLVQVTGAISDLSGINGLNLGESEYVTLLVPATLLSTDSRATEVSNTTTVTDDKTNRSRKRKQNFDTRKRMLRKRLRNSGFMNHTICI